LAEIWLKMLKRSVFLFALLVVFSAATDAGAWPDSGTIDIRDYGASTNRPDNSPAIANALAVAKAQQKRLHLPPGT
jgi:hypothetical protein